MIFHCRFSPQNNRNFTCVVNAVEAVNVISGTDFFQWGYGANSELYFFVPSEDDNLYFI
jgi:hypothetical protein